jgi:acyl-CoA thioesterase
MPQSATEIVDLEDLGHDHFAGGHPETSLLAKVFGGQLIGQAPCASCAGTSASTDLQFGAVQRPAPGTTV